MDPGVWSRSPSTTNTVEQPPGRACHFNTATKRGTTGRDDFDVKRSKNKGKHLFNAHSDGHLVMHIKYQYCRKCDPNIASSSL